MGPIVENNVGSYDLCTAVFDGQAACSRICRDQGLFHPLLISIPSPVPSRTNLCSLVLSLSEFPSLLWDPCFASPPPQHPDHLPFAYLNRACRSMAVGPPFHSTVTSHVPPQCSLVTSPLTSQPTARLVLRPQACYIVSGTTSESVAFVMCGPAGDHSGREGGTLWGGAELSPYTQGCLVHSASSGGAIRGFERQEEEEARGPSAKNRGSRQR